MYKKTQSFYFIHMFLFQSSDKDLCGGLQCAVYLPNGGQQKERALHRQIHRLLPLTV